MSTPLRVAVCQVDDGDREAALAALGTHVERTGAELVVLPELPFSAWLAAGPVPDPDAWRRSVAEHDAAIDRLGALGASAVVGSRPTLGPDGARRNAAFVWTAGTGAVRVRDKRYLPDEPGYWEASWYGRGEPSTDTCSVLSATVAVALCTDLWFLEHARAYARAGVDLLAVPRVTPAESTDTWLAGGRVAAVCAGAYCASANSWTPGGTGTAPGGLGWIVGPDGDVLATTTPERPFVTVEIDLDAARHAKTTYPRYVLE